MISLYFFIDISLKLCEETLKLVLAENDRSIDI